VSLAVSTFEPWYVNTVAAWTLAGTAGMGLVAVLSAANPMLAEGAMLATAQSSALVANTLIGGAVGGALIGVRSARNRRQRRALARQSDQAVVLDRIFRDEVLNAWPPSVPTPNSSAMAAPTAGVSPRSPARPTAFRTPSRTWAFSSSPAETAG